MRKLSFLLLLILTALTTAFAAVSDQPADPALAAALLPGYTYVSGVTSSIGGELRLLMLRPDGALVFIGGVQAADGTWSLTESTPLPEGTILGYNNFTTSLGIPMGEDYLLADINPYPDGAWRVSLLTPGGTGEPFHLGQHCVYTGMWEIFGHFGNHPWGNITAIDWTTLPRSYEEAVAALDTDHWAVVNSHFPSELLHLRTEADRNAPSLGLYYNRTPVYVRQWGEAWCAVTIGGVDGWMMTDYLTPASEGSTVSFGPPWLEWKGAVCPLYAAPDVSGPSRELTPDSFIILGIVDEWFHVMLTGTEEYGYIPQDALWFGNG